MHASSNAKEAIYVFPLEKHGLPKPTALVYAHLLNMYMLVNDVKGACVMFGQFHNLCT
jgi:hypothetical protein